MKCARVRLQEREREKSRHEKSSTTSRPQRYCQQLMVDPDHDKEVRWATFLHRFQDDDDNVPDDQKNISEQITDDIFLSVQNLKLPPVVESNKRTRASFKYKSIVDGKNHRMFIKQNIDSDENYLDNTTSDLSPYYFEEYYKYINNGDKSKTSSVKSSLCHYDNSDCFTKNKAIQVNLKSLINDNIKQTKVNKKSSKIEDKKFKTRICDFDNKENDINYEDDTKIALKMSGKRKSLTISRTNSPETIQVIRVDVVCNNANNINISDNEESNKKEISKPLSIENNPPTKVGRHYASKYLLTSTIKSLEEVVSSTKVTLLCKTFTLVDRVKSRK